MSGISQGSGQRQIITLISDFGCRDGFVGIMKAVMLGIYKDIEIVDVSHEIPPYNVNSAAFVLGQSYSYFPENTIHVVVVDPEVGSRRKIVYVEAGAYRFLAPNNGVLQYIHYWEDIHLVVDVNNRDYFLPEQSSTFHGRDIFAPVAAHLARGLDPLKLGDQTSEFYTRLPPKPTVETKNIRGEIIHIDHYGNLVSNIPASSIDDLRNSDSDFCIEFAGYKIRELSESFYVKSQGELLAYIDSSKFLSFALNGQNAAEKMGLSIGDKVEISRF